MANKRFYQFLHTKQPKLTMINGLITFGASGAVSAVSGGGVQGVTKLATGQYQIKLNDNYVAYIGAQFCMLGGVTGSVVTDGSFAVGTLYQILTLGTTAWTSYGFDSDYTPAIGGLFVATAVGGAGGGTVKAIGPSSVMAVEVAQSQQALMKNNYTNSNRGSSIIIQTYNVSDALVSPASGAQMSFKIWLRDSTVSAL